MAVFQNIISSLGKSADFFTVFGVTAASFVAFKAALGVFRFISTYVLAGLLGLSADLKKAGSWAVVTGCTDGIGKAYAEQLAERGINVVLISRTASKLDDLAKEIESKYKVQTRVVAVDFTRADIYSTISRSLEGLEIGTLVNNVGMSFPFPEYFIELENREQVIRDMINVNMLSMTMLTSMVLPAMVERRRGYIINIASTAATAPLALLGLYSASKVYMDYFSQTLQQEVSNKGITVQVVLPGFVATKLSKIKKTSFMIPSPTTYVRSALATVGIENRTFGFWSHAVQGFLMASILPSMVQRNVMLGARKAGLRKRNQKKE
ncbi:hypothetical protein SNE40_006632 [Patella caerulea]|uniref:Uncharacterized protein n=1 Tax=Patella caerulea TaxID=87958 RepID=A0AAN8JXZ1_PATCE